MQQLSSVPGSLVKMSSLDNLDKIYELWNKEYHQIYPISHDLFYRNLRGFDDSSSFAWVLDDKIIGFIIGKTYNEDFVIERYKSLGWISLFYVSPAYRNQGIGSLLLEECIKSLKAAGKTQVNLGSDYNPYFPGIPVDLQIFRKFFINRGFDHSYMTYDLFKKNDHNYLPIMNSDITYRIGNISDKDGILEFIGRCWPGRWLKEAIDYFDAGGDASEYMIGLNEANKVIAFAKVCNSNTKEDLISFSLTWRDKFNKLGGIGPLGVDPDYRKRHIGYDIVAASHNYLVDCDVEHIIIDWTGLLEFYRKMGFEVWKCYFYFNKQI